MITDLSKLEGTCYIEILPGKYVDKCWNSQSVFFEEEHFGFIEATILRHYPAYDHYAFANIEKVTWGRIVSDLQRLRDKITTGTRLSDIEGDVDLFFTTTKQRFLGAESQNLSDLRETLVDFISWTQKTLEQHDTISILGI